MLRGNHRIRQMIDTIESPHSIVLEYAEEDLRSLSIRRKLQRVETKTIARQLLEALAFAHAKNIVHTGRNASNHIDTFYRLPYHGQISSHRIFCFLDLHPTSSLLKHRSNWLILLMVCLILLIDVNHLMFTFPKASPPSDYKISPKSFRSPESWLGLPWGPAADIWSFGAVV